MANYDAVERELSSGRPWRAKEILQGSLRSAAYDVLLLERYGAVLLQLGDLVEAGKYLFLSGSRKPEYMDAIAIYLRRHGKSMRALHATFPAFIRKSDIAAYPEKVLSDLQLAGFGLGDLKRESLKEIPSGRIGWDLFIGIALFTFLCLLIVGLVVQAFRGMGWLFETMSGVFD